MIPLRMAAVLVAAALTLAGCANYHEVPFDRQAAAIKSIGLLTPQFPSEPRIQLASSVGQSFGLIGAIVDSGMESKRDSGFQTLLLQQSFSAQATLTDALTSALRAEGYDVASVPVSRAEPGYLKAYPTNAGPRVDAYLDIVVDNYGYLAAGISDATPYRPHFWVSARLVRASDAAVLMRATLVYNYVGPSENYITLAPDPAYVFVNFDALMADPPQSTKGLREAIGQSAATLASLLK